jgi:hypothetical protein
MDYLFHAPSEIRQPLARPIPEQGNLIELSSIQDKTTATINSSANLLTPGRRPSMTPSDDRPLADPRPDSPFRYGLEPHQARPIKKTNSGFNIDMDLFIPTLHAEQSRHEFQQIRLAAEAPGATRSSAGICTSAGEFV